MNKIKWLSLDNEFGTATCKQHGFVNNDGRNISLCGKAFVINDSEEAEIFIRIEDGVLNRNNACKLCLKALDKINKY